MLDFVKTNEHLLINLLTQNQLGNKTVVKQMDIKIYTLLVKFTEEYGLDLQPSAAP